ncbi:MAG: hypothetical protein U9Q99_00905 [Nanoarchaeota archaeon]|nr:hypothetical protein [Nanoarchaeota archaeon]
MGAPTDMLVVVSTMYENPKGLTKEEVLDEFNKIKLRSPLGVGDELNSGLHGFARLFNLKHTKQYLENRKKYWNEDYKYFSKRENLWRNYFCRVTETSHKSIGKTEIQYKLINSSEFGETIFKGHKVGERVWRDYFTEIKIPEKFKNSNYHFIVRKINNQKVTMEDFNSVTINEDLEVEVVKFDSKNFKFNSFEKLWESYPEYHPENTHNFNQESGFLYSHRSWGIRSESPSFRWFKKGDKYFLDFEHFSKILNPNSYFGKNGWKHKGQKNKSRYSLTDVILTSEAIRRRNWRKLGYNAFFSNNENFIYGNEKTLRRYERAVLETELVVEAQKKGWTNSEFLREYHSRISNRNQVPYEDIKRMLKEENKQRGIERRKTTLRLKKEEKEKKPEIPF